MKSHCTGGRLRVTGLLVLCLTKATISFGQSTFQSETRGREQAVDSRHQQGHVTPRWGTPIRSLPPGYRPCFHHGSLYYFYGGVWYAPAPGGFTVVRPPLGLHVGILPPYPTTMWFDGVPYSYPDGTYYQWAPGLITDAIIAPPSVAPSSAPPPELPGTSGEALFIYPQNQQSAAQQATDRFECHTWSRDQTGFDPTKASDKVPSMQDPAGRAPYDRAMTACLEARGYSVR